MTRFGVLGPLTAQGAGNEPIPLAAQLHRRLLAVLLCQPGKPVSLEQICEALWPHEPPRSARKTVQGYVHRLRRLLEADGQQRITFGPYGYTLHASPEEIDAQRFVALAEAGRLLDRSGQPEQASELLRHASDLWRGPAFAELRVGALITDHALWLEEQRALSEEERVRIDLELGRHNELIPELSALVDTHPFREQLRHHLLIALYRAGRKNEALQAYRTTRQQFIDELGVEPGLALQQAHEAILRDDPDLVPAPAAPAVPRQLPADVAGFTAREHYLKQLDALTQNDGLTMAIPLIAGMAGVGKTTLAVHWAHQSADRFPDGTLYVDLRGFDSAGNVAGPDEALRSMLHAIGVAHHQMPADVTAQATLLRSQLSGKRMLIVLDNARDAGQVRPLLPNSAGCVVLITSRNNLSSLVAIEGAKILNLDLLTLEESRQLLASRLEAQRVEAEPAATDLIAVRCGGLPIALAVMAAHAACHPGFTLAEIARQLEASQGLDAFAGGDDFADVRSVFACSYRALDEAAAQLFRQLSVHPGPDLGVGAVASLAAAPARFVQSLLSRLEQHHLIRQPSPGRYVMHDLMREFAHELAEESHSADETRAMLQRLLDHYLHILHRTESLLDPVRDPITIPEQPEQPVPELTEHDDALAWYSTEYAAVLALIDRAYAAGFDIHCWQMTWMMANFLERQGHWRDWARVAELGVTAANRFGDHSAEARCRRTLARAHARLGNHEVAQEHLLAAMQIYRAADDEIGQAYVHLNLNIVNDDRQQYGDALAHATEALTLFRAADHIVGTGLALNAIGWAESHLGNHETGLSYCQQAIELQQNHSDRTGEADTWDSVGYIQLQLANYPGAADSLKNALSLFRELGDRYNEATTLIRLGDLGEANGDLATARDCWQQALYLLAQLGHDDADLVLAKLRTQWSTQS